MLLGSMKVSKPSFTNGTLGTILNITLLRVTRIFWVKIFVPLLGYFSHGKSRKLKPLLSSMRHASKKEGLELLEVIPESNSYSSFSPSAS